MTLASGTRALTQKLRTARNSWRERSRFQREFGTFSGLCRAEGVLSPQWDDRYPITNEATPTTEFDAHYIYHPAWAARLIKSVAPIEHIDISSSLSFCAMLSTWMPTRFFDFRPAPLHLSQLTCEKADVTALQFADNSIPSLSCMHVVEHIGLGRYGDPLDARGDAKAMKELARVLAVGGHLYFVTPVGKPRIQFNAHRIYSFEQVIDNFAGLQLKEWALLPDDPTNGLELNPDPARVGAQSYGCGCFCFSKQAEEFRL